jgi:cysteine synthase A
VDSPAEMYAESARLAEELGGHYMDQFTYAERATDWRGNNNIAESIFSQMSHEEHPVPSWIVVGAGTGGTSATLGRYIRYRRLPTRLCLSDPEASVFHRHLADREVCTVSGPPSVIEGIGRPRCEPSFVPDLIDRTFAVPDAASIAAARVLSRRIGRSCGGSTGTNLWAVAQIVGEMVQNGEQGSVVTLLCDSGERYRSTHFDDAWLASRGIDIGPAEDAMERFFETGVLGTK